MTTQKTELPSLVAGSPQFAAYTGEISPDSKAAIDTALSQLQVQKDAWVSLDISERIAILDEIREDLQSVAGRWVSACLKAKGIDPDNAFAVGEEWTFLAAVFRMVRLLRNALIDIQGSGNPRVPGPLTIRADGQVTLRVFPQTALDRLLYTGTTAEIWLQPGVTVEEMQRSQASFYRYPNPQGKITLVLGAGNVASLVPGDFLHALFVKGQVVVLKPNPVNDYLGPIIEDGFKALIKRGYLRVISGGVAEGNYLCHHPQVETVHLTGSDKTYEAIVFGPGSQGAKRKRNRTPLLTKPFTAELGNVTPIIVVPGPWTEADIQAQAQKIATWLVTNAGFNCLTPRVMIQSKSWPHRTALTRAVGDALAQVATRTAYYPGASARQAQFIDTHPQAGLFGQSQADHLPWTLIPDVDPNQPNDICFRSEAFCGLMAETALDAETTEEFIKQAVEFCNNTLWGTLTAAIIAHPKLLKDKQVGAAIEEAVANLRYGTVTINQYGGYAYYLMLPVWGGYPGQDIYDIQSGIGMVNNVLMLEQVQKSVVQSMFRPVADPFILSFDDFDKFGQRLVDWEMEPEKHKLPGLLWSVVRGVM